MCGIAAVYSYHQSAPLVDRDELRQISARMVVRGPDGEGEWYSDDGRVGLAHRRLAIIDLSDAGAQPMVSRDGTLRITYNGEIYNYKALRKTLEEKGYHFKSAADTEVLLHLYQEKGRDMVCDLRGMFAFAIWDDRKKALFIVRDPFGIKPLYFSDDGKSLKIASQVKALVAGGNVDTSADPAGHVGFFLWGHMPEPYTLYRGIRSLPAGSFMWINEDGKGQIKSFCNISKELANASYNKEDLRLQENLREALLDSISHHLVADVPVGIFLSSGLDSTTITALSSELTKGKLHTITLGFDEFRGTQNDEAPLAELVGRQYGTEHKTSWVKKEDFKEELPHLLNSMDQPSTDGVNTYFVSRAAARAGLKVCMSGLGGDELFGGYPSFDQIPRMAGKLRFLSAIPAMGTTFRRITAPVLKYFTSPKYAGLLEYGGSYGGAYLLRRGMFMPWELPEFMDGDMVREGWKELDTLMRLEDTTDGIKSDHLKISSLEMTWYMRNQLLRDADWAGMAHSLEIRVPLVDIELLRELVSLLGQNALPGKLEMALTPMKPLPDGILKRAKSGFSVPVREWMMEDKGELPLDRGLRGWAKYVYSQLTT